MKKTQINTVSFGHGFTRINTVNFFFIAILLFLNCVSFAEENPFRKTFPVSDGFMLDGIDGKITSQNDQWYFTAFEPMTDGKGVMTSPAAILPSSMLEKLTNAATQEKSTFRIWGKLTKYQGRNYVYLSYFLPVAEVNEPNTVIEEKDTNEVEIIPEEALALLKPKRVISLTELKKPLGVLADGILSDRTGFLEQTKDGCYFGFDAMGRNIDLMQFPLLQCEELENMETQQKASALPLRFKIAAIVTRYKGRNYLLLHRVTRLYSHGNFVR